MQENETEQTKTGSWPEIRSIGEDIEEDTDTEESSLETEKSETEEKD